MGSTLSSDLVGLVVEQDNRLNEYIMNELPSEILTKIFANLFLDDRKNAKLVCHKWLFLLSEPQFTRNEKLMCFGLYDLDTIVRTLEDTSRKVLNLEFNNVKFEDFSWFRTFWERCGPKIECLQFQNCMLSRETMEQVFRHCNRLKCLSFEDMTTFVSEKEVYKKITCFQGAAHLRVESLHSLKLSISNVSQLSNDFLFILTEIFPNIKEFAFRCADTIMDDDFFGVEEDGELPSTRKYSSFMDFGTLLDWRKTEIESIAIDEEDPRDLLVAISMIHIFPHYFPKLKRVKVGLGLYDALKQPKLDFFMRHIQLQSVDCLLHFCSDVSGPTAGEYAEKLMSCVFVSCPNLRNFKLFQCQEDYGLVGIQHITLDESASMKLVNSQIESLNINFNLVLSLPSNVEVINERLKSLEISAPLKLDSFSLLSKTFRGLTHLMVVYFDDETLQNIFQYQKNLTSLQLINFQNCTDYGFIGNRFTENEERDEQYKSYSIRSLEKLRFFELSMCSCHDSHTPKVSETVFQEFVFPNLQYLSIAINAPWELCPKLVEACSNFAKLEGLNFSFYQQENPIDYSFFWELCGQLTELKYMSILFDGNEVFGDMDYEHLFQQCPSLRVIRTRDRSYYYDVVKRRLAKKSIDPSYRLCPKKIDGFSFNWMWF